MSGIPLRVLIVEDCEDDALLLEAELRQGGYRPQCRRVVTAAEFSAALGQEWDLVIADYSLPSFNAPAALAILKQRKLDLPFIVVSGVLEEDTAVTIMKAGAHDYFRKSNLTLLSAAVRRELREAAVRAQQRRADRRLREQEVRYRTLFEQSPDGILLIDPTTLSAVEFNDAVCRMLGYTRDEFRRLTISDYEVGETPAEIAAHARQLLATGHGEFETRHRTKEGEVRDVWVTAQSISLSGVHLLHVLFRDITSLKGAERAFREAEEKYHTLIQAATDAIVIIDVDSGTIVDVNLAAAELVGRELSELIGLHHTALHPLHERLFYEQLLERLVASGRSMLSNLYLCHRTGRAIPVEVSSCVAVTGGRRIIQCIYRDVSARRHAEELLLEGETRYRQLLSAVNSYTYTVHCQNRDTPGTEHGSGCLAVTGYAPDEYRADPYLWIKMVHPDDRELVRQHVAALLAGGDPPPLEHRIVRRDGRLCWIRGTIVKHHNEQRELVSYDGLIEDITARRQAEQELNEQKAQLIVARRIQEHLLPRLPPLVPGFEIAGASYSSDFTAGDYFDYIPMIDGSWAIVIGDVAGHRFASALLMASTRAYIRSLAKMHTSVAEILGLANTILLGDVEEDHFVTLFLGRLNPTTRSLVYASAGHETCYLLDRTGAIKVRLGSTGFPLAVAAEAEYFAGGPHTFEPGDILLLVTDGVHDVRSPAGVQFGTTRMLEVVQQHALRPAQDIVERLRDAVFAYIADHKPDDDVTVVVVKAQG